MADISALIHFRTQMEGANQVDAYSRSLDGLLGAVGKVAAGYLTVQAAQKAWDIAKQGAVINQTRESFDRLNESVFLTPNLLEDMQRASRGTVGELDLMRGVLTNVAGLSNEVARTFAQASPQLLEIAKAANKLNPTLGDTAFLYESISLGIKRSSKLILDNLGINVSLQRANEEYAKSVGKSVLQLTAEEKQLALLNETMRVGNQLIEQAGGNVDSATDSYAQMEVAVKGAFSVFKSETATAAAEQMGLLADETGSAEENFRELAAMLGTTFGTILGNTAKDIENIIRIIHGLELSANGDMSSILGDATLFKDGSFNTDFLGDFNRATGMGTNDFRRSFAEMLSDDSATRGLIQHYRDVGQEMGAAVVEGVEQGTDGLEEWTDAAKASVLLGMEQADMWREAGASIQATLNEAAEKQREAIEEARQARLEWQAENQAVGRAAFLGGMDTLGTPDALVSDQMLVNTDALNKLLFDQAAAAGADSSALAAVGIATGQLTEAQAEALITTEAITIRAKILAEQLASGAISAEEAKAGLMHFAETLVSTEESAGGATDEVIALKDEVLNLSQLDVPPVRLEVENEGALTAVRRTKEALEDFNLNREQGDATQTELGQPVEFRPENLELIEAQEAIERNRVEQQVDLVPDTGEVDSEVNRLESTTVYVPVVFVPQNDPTPPGGNPNPPGGRPNPPIEQSYVVPPGIYAPAGNYGAMTSTPNYGATTATGPATVINQTFISNTREAAALNLAAADLARRKHYDRVMGVGS